MKRKMSHNLALLKEVLKSKFALSLLVGLALTGATTYALTQRSGHSEGRRVEVQDKVVDRDLITVEKSSAGSKTKPKSPDANKEKLTKSPATPTTNPQGVGGASATPSRASVKEGASSVSSTPDTSTSNKLVASSYSVRLGGSAASIAYVDVSYTSGKTIEWLQISKQPRFEVSSEVHLNGVYIGESQLAGTGEVKKRTLQFSQTDTTASGSATVYITTTPNTTPIGIRVSWSPVAN